MVAFNNDILLLGFIIIAPVTNPDCNIKLFVLLKTVSPVLADDEKAPAEDAML